MGGRGKKTTPSSSRRSSDRIKAKSQPPTTMEKVEEEVDESSSSASVNGEQSLNSSQVLEQAFLNIVNNNRSGESSFSSPLRVNHHSEFCIDPICSNPVCIQRIQNRDPEQYRHLKFRIDGIEFSPYDNIDHHHSEIREIQARMNLLRPQTPAMTVSKLSSSNPVLAANGTTLHCTSTTSDSQESQARDSSNGNHSDPHAHGDVSIINHSDPHAHGDVSTINHIAQDSNLAAGAHIANEQIGQHYSARAFSIGGEHLDPQDTHGNSISECDIFHLSNSNGQHSQALGVNMQPSAGPAHSIDSSRSLVPQAHGDVPPSIQAKEIHVESLTQVAHGNLSSHVLVNKLPLSQDLSNNSNSSGKHVDPQASALVQSAGEHIGNLGKASNEHMVAPLNSTIAAAPQAHGVELGPADEHIGLNNSEFGDGHFSSKADDHGNPRESIQSPNTHASPLSIKVVSLAAHDNLSSHENVLPVSQDITHESNSSGKFMDPQAHSDDSAHQNSANGIANIGEHVDPHGTTISDGQKTSFAGQNASTLVHEIVSPAGPTLAQDSNLAVGKKKEHKLSISSGEHADPISHEGPGHQQIPAHIATLVNPLVQPSSSIFQHGNNVHLEEFPPLQASGKSHNNVAQNHETSSTNWKGIFMGELNNSLKLNFYAYKEEDGKAVASPPAEIFHAGATHWQRCLIGQFFDKPPPFFLIQKIVDTKWKKFGAVDIRSTESGMFVFQFETEAICDIILEELWHVYHCPLLLRRWTPGTQLINLKCNRVPIWLKLIDVPLDLWHQEGLSYVASTIGFPLQMDSLTASRRHLGYARVCVEMNAEKDFPNSTLVELLGGTKAKVQIEYTWKPKKCSHCKVFGHNEVTCIAIPKETLPVPVVNITHSAKENEWKTVGNVTKNNIKTSLTTNASTKNRFDVFSANPEIDYVKPNEPGAASTSQQTIANKNATDPAPGKNVEHTRKDPKYPQKAYRNAQAIFTQRGRKSSDNFNNRAKSKIDTKVRDKARVKHARIFSSPSPAPLVKQTNLMALRTILTENLLIGTIIS